MDMNHPRDALNSIQRPTKFDGKSSEYITWRRNCETVLRHCNYWDNLHSKHSDGLIKFYSSILILESLGEEPQRVCGKETGDPLRMLELLDNTYTSNSENISVVGILSKIFAKRYQPRESVYLYIQEFEKLFQQLDSIGAENCIQKGVRGTILMLSFGSCKYESVLLPLQYQHPRQITWEKVSLLLLSYEKSTIQKGKTDSNRIQGHETNWRNRVLRDSTNIDDRHPSLDFRTFR